MITRDKKLQIFENFFTDSSLKKKSTKLTTGSSIIVDGDDVSINTSFITTNISGGSVPNGFIREENAMVIEYLEYVYAQNRTIINWCKLKLGRIFMPDGIKKDVIKYKSVDSFFKDVHGAVKELGLDPKSVEFYTSAMQDAKDNGQQALLEILASRKDTLLRELKLLKDNKKIQYVDEKDVVNFFGKSNVGDKYLKLTWIKNYVRVIPTDVLEKKKKFDENESFDNYVILHFDKNNDSTEMTEKEKVKAKDPILFGLISGSRRLYFVGDWEDEYCDLTLDKFIKTLEQKKIKELNNASIKKEILNTK